MLRFPRHANQKTLRPLRLCAFAVQTTPRPLVEDLHDDLKRKRYRPQAVRLKLIPKANGGHRPLGIPTI